MDSSFLKDLIGESVHRGWAQAVMDELAKVPWRRGIEDEITFQADQLGLVPAENRRGHSPVSALRPTRQGDAHPASLSAQVGLGEQPLHTDGAHLRKVPDLVVMWSSTTSATPTRVWDARRAGRGKDDSGIFMIRSGGETWLSPARDSGGLRFDPGCMAPCDAFARETAQILQAPPPDQVHEIAWTKPGMVLVLRNRWVLHGRAAVVPGDEARTLGRVAYYTGSAR